MNAVLTKEKLVNKQEQLESKLWELLLLGETNGDVKESIERGTASISEKKHAKDFFYKKSRYIKNKTALLYVKDVNSFAQCHVILQICILQEN
ncbi:uncharacterized protein KNN_07125 (plasmid) [Bacillus thuringiensis serovar tolworthi]|uniref:Uncharacterized protein n=1 Tax=Bacillus thuringiensis subsp. tolworthi TaxID=1442 RepID=A0A9W4A3Z7_BACTO|nr:uncharacterized protein KNN_07125 [Bacillus thuringiensis serovar tolworthi]